MNYQMRLDLRVVESGRRCAFGYGPDRWPSTRMFGEAVTPTQIKMIRLKAEARGISSLALPFLRALILNAYEVSDANSRGNASLFVDWLMHADDYAVDEAMQAVEYYEQLDGSVRAVSQGAA